MSKHIRQDPPPRHCNVFAAAEDLPALTSHSQASCREDLQVGPAHKGK